MLWVEDIWNLDKGMIRKYRYNRAEEKGKMKIKMKIANVTGRPGHLTWLLLVSLLISHR